MHCIDMASSCHTHLSLILSPSKDARSRCPRPNELNADFDHDSAADAAFEDLFSEIEDGI
jgi:hypothetical protein